MITSNDIKKYAAQIGADLCGIASIDRFDDAPKGFHPTDVYKDTRSIVSFACRVPATSLRVDCTSSYTAIEEIAMSRVNQISLSIALYIEQCGFNAVLIPSVPYDYWDAESKTGKGILSLKHLGQKAGLGYIGKNALLCNKSFGNLIKLGAVITNAELVPDKPIDSDMCVDSCSLCIDSCPSGAIGLNSVVTQKKCREHSEIHNKRGVEIYACHECRNVCPNRYGYKEL